MTVRARSSRTTAARYSGSGPAVRALIQNMPLIAARYRLRLLAAAPDLTALEEQGAADAGDTGDEAAEHRHEERLPEGERECNQTHGLSGNPTNRAVPVWSPYGPDLVIPLANPLAEPIAGSR